MQGASSYPPLFLPTCCCAFTRAILQWEQPNGDTSGIAPRAWQYAVPPRPVVRAARSLSPGRIRLWLSELQAASRLVRRLIELIPTDQWHGELHVLLLSTQAGLMDLWTITRGVSMMEPDEAGLGNGSDEDAWA